MRIVAAFIFSLAAAASFALGLPMADETPTADSASPPAAEAVADKTDIPIEERLPPGFKVKKRGKFTLFCKTDTPLGTRFKSETCYDEANMRAYMLALEENKSDVDRIRNICSNPCACGRPEAC
jgi:hypothetical protein